MASQEDMINNIKSRLSVTESDQTNICSAVRLTELLISLLVSYFSLPRETTLFDDFFFIFMAYR